MPKQLLRGYPTEFSKMAEMLLELFLNQNIKNLKWRSLQIEKLSLEIFKYDFQDLKKN
jgi:hypothetical protein